MIKLKGLIKKEIYIIAEESAFKLKRASKSSISKNIIKINKN